MFTPLPSEPKRSKIRTEREYREWQLSLRENMPVKRLKTGPGFLTRLARTLRYMVTRRFQPVAEPRRIEQKAC
jgi:hypothetical protein